VTSDYLLRNRAAWNTFAEDFETSGHEDWSAEEPTWGIWGIPESQVHMLDDVDGLTAVELGCGTAYVSAWLARRGARAVGIDNSPRQLETARRFQAEFELEFPLIQGDAERTPFADAVFDLAISEYGAAIWCDPYVWIPEAARLLRPGGRLLFLGHSPLAMICSPFDDEVVPIEDRLIRDQFGMHRFDWSDATEFQISHSETIGLLHSCGFEIEELHELQPSEGSTTAAEWVSLDWARRWPSEDVWKARKRA
jgi:SAM-dependent methyltransferase